LSASIPVESRPFKIRLSSVPAALAGDSLSTLRRYSAVPNRSTSFLYCHEQRAEHVAHALARHVAQARHRGAELLNFLDFHVPQHRCRGLLAEGEEQNRGPLRAFDRVYFSHFLPTPSS
jgi:hypothetical protein